MTSGLSLRSALSHECPVCLRLRNEERADEDSTETALFGVRAYYQCPGCRQIIHDELVHDAEYRRRARVRHFEITGEVWPS